MYYTVPSDTDLSYLMSDAIDDGGSETAPLVAMHKTQAHEAMKSHISSHLGNVETAKRFVLLALISEIRTLLTCVQIQSGLYDNTFNVTGVCRSRSADERCYSHRFRCDQCPTELFERTTELGKRTHRSARISTRCRPTTNVSWCPAPSLWRYIIKGRTASHIFDNANWRVGRRRC